MRVLIVLFSFFAVPSQGLTLKYHRPWIGPRDSEAKAISALLKELAKTPTGASLIDLAKKKAKSRDLFLEDIIRPGPLSATDTTLVRRFSPAKPNEVSYVHKSLIYLNKNLKTQEAILDLAHELVHFSLRDSFNPYGKGFALVPFIASMLEGPGGEVEAFLTECRILGEIYGPFSQGMPSNCKDILRPDGSFDRAQGLKKFYRIGAYYEGFVTNLRRQGLGPGPFPHLRPAEALFISSVHDLPYPVAAYREFMDIRARACANEGRRLSLMRAGGFHAAEESALHQGRCLFGERD